MNNNEIKVAIGLFGNDIKQVINEIIALLNSDLTANDKVQKLAELLQKEGNYIALLDRHTPLNMPNATHFIFTTVTAGECEIKNLDVHKIPKNDFIYKSNPILELPEFNYEKSLIFTNESARNLRRKAERNKKKKK